MSLDVFWGGRLDKSFGPCAFAHYPLDQWSSSSRRGYKPGEPEIKFADVKKRRPPVGVGLANCFGEVPEVPAARGV